MNRPSIDQLQEIALPDAPAYAPNTWGWAALGGVLLALLLAWALWRLRRWQQNRYRREALQQLQRIEAAAANDPLALRELPELLKRTALSWPTPAPVQALRGSAWQAFLQAHSSAPLPADFSAQLAGLAYAPVHDWHDTRALLQHCRHWLEHHHVAT